MRYVLANLMTIINKLALTGKIRNNVYLNEHNSKNLRAFFSLFCSETSENSKRTLN